MKSTEQNSAKPIRVVCGIIWKDDKVLIARRKPEKSLGGFWEFPGGKIRQNEDPIDALKRELNEEFLMSIADPKFLGEHIHHYTAFTIHLIGYSCKFLNAKFQLTDHDQYCFIDPHLLDQFKLAPADSPFVEKIIRAD